MRGGQIQPITKRRNSKPFITPLFLSVVMPTYKQSRTIRFDIAKIRSALEPLKIRHEIIIVVDGTVDKTLENAKKVANKTVRVFGYNQNRGKGYAIRYGVARARGDLIAFIDSGMDLNPQGISMLIEHMRWYDADIIVGSKRHPVSKVDYPVIRRVLSLGYQLIVRVLFHVRIRDTQTGLKLFRRKVLDDVMPRLLVKRFAFDIEVLSVAHYLGYKRIFEAPIELHYNFRKTSIMNRKILLTVLHMLWDTMAVFYRLHILHYYHNQNQHRWLRDPELHYSQTIRFAQRVAVRKKHFPS